MMDRESQEERLSPPNVFLESWSSDSDDLHLSSLGMWPQVLMSNKGPVGSNNASSQLKNNTLVL